MKVKSDNLWTQVSRWVVLQHRSNVSPAPSKARARQHLRPRSRSLATPTKDGTVAVVANVASWKNLGAPTGWNGRTDGPARRFRRSGVSLRVMRVNVTGRRGIDRVQGFHSFVLQSRCGSGFIFAALSSNLLFRAHTLTSQNHKLNIRFAVQVARSSRNYLWINLSIIRVSGLEVGLLLKSDSECWLLARIRFGWKRSVDGSCNDSFRLVRVLQYQVKVEESICLDGQVPTGWWLARMPF